MKRKDFVDVWIPEWEQLKKPETAHDLTREKIYGNTFLTQNEYNQVIKDKLQFFMQIHDKDTLIRIFRNGDMGMDFKLFPYSIAKYNKELSQYKNFITVCSNANYACYVIKKWNKTKENSAKYINDSPDNKYTYNTCIKKGGTQETAQKGFQQKYSVLFVDSLDKVVQHNAIGDVGFMMIGPKSKGRYQLYVDCL